MGNLRGICNTDVDKVPSIAKMQKVGNKLQILFVDQILNLQKQTTDHILALQLYKRLLKSCYNKNKGNSFNLLQIC